jgi:predicted CoA-binding protein
MNCRSARQTGVWQSKIGRLEARPRVPTLTGLHPARAAGGTLNRLRSGTVAGLPLLPVKIAMVPTPPLVADFLSARRVAVPGVSRSGSQPANAILRRLRDGGQDVVAINPHAAQLEGARCYPDLAAVPGVVDGLMVVVPPAAAERLVRQATARGITRIWFHRSFGDGSVSESALKACAELGIRPIVGGCPLMYCPPVDVAHRCMRWLPSRRGRIAA